MIAQHLSDPAVLDALDRGELVVARTDTIYGILAKTSNIAAMHKLYQVKQRDANKGCITLVSRTDDIPGLSGERRDDYVALNADRPTTVVTPVDSRYLPHLVREHDTLAFRLVHETDLAQLIDKTGPLLAPSANPANLPPARTIAEAINYFGDAVAVYVDGGEVRDIKPSRIITINNHVIEIIRD